MINKNNSKITINIVAQNMKDRPWCHILDYNIDNNFAIWLINYKG